jgi:hypothetical protein
MLIENHSYLMLKRKIRSKLHIQPQKLAKSTCKYA